jgi:hypothetical protein
MPIKFIQEYPATNYHSGSYTEISINEDSSIDEVIESFELFLKGCGYHLPDGANIGYEYIEDYSKFEPNKEDECCGCGGCSNVSLTPEETFAKANEWTKTFHSVGLNPEHSAYSVTFNTDNNEKE